MTTGIFSSALQAESPVKVLNNKTNMPGPGYYDPPETITSNEKQAVGSSMFKSDSVRELA
jgi:hypothetical protein